jgi:hypothetical protein
VRRGGLLVEMIVSVALFAGAGLIVIGAMRDALGATIRAMERDRAADHAASAFALVSAGIETVDTIDGPVPAYDDPENNEQFADLLPEPTGWVIETETERSVYGSLTRLSVTARRVDETGRAEPGAPGATVDGLAHIARVVEDAALEESELGRELDRLDGGGSP